MKSPCSFENRRLRDASCAADIGNVGGPVINQEDAPDRRTLSTIHPGLAIRCQPERGVFGKTSEHQALPVALGMAWQTRKPSLPKADEPHAADHAFMSECIRKNWKG